MQKRTKFELQDVVKPCILPSEALSFMSSMKDLYTTAFLNMFLKQLCCKISSAVDEVMSNSARKLGQALSVTP